MANVNYISSFWVSREGHDLNPGDKLLCSAYGFNAADAVSVSAHPVSIEPPEQRLLAIEDLRIGIDSSGTRMMWCYVRNVGSTSIPACYIGVSWVSA